MCLADLQLQRQRLAFRIGVDFSINIDKGITKGTKPVGDIQQPFFKRAHIVPAVIAKGEGRLQAFNINILDLAGDIDISNTVALAFLQNECDGKSCAVWQQSATYTADIDIRITAGQVKLAQQAHIVIKTRFIIFVG